MNRFGGFVLPRRSFFAIPRAPISTLRRRIDASFPAPNFPLSRIPVLHPSPLRSPAQLLKVRTKTLLATGIVYGALHSFRYAMTAIPVLWRWNFFKKYPQTMKTISATLALGIITMIVLHLEMHPMTQRVRFMFVDEDTEMELAQTSYEQLMNQSKGKILPLDHPWVVRAQAIVNRIVSVVGKDLRDWKLIVVNDPDVANAMVLPNGVIFLYTGMMNVILAMACADPNQTAIEDIIFNESNPANCVVSKSSEGPLLSLIRKVSNQILPVKKPTTTAFDDILAGVLAHETAHVLSRHGAENVGMESISQLFVDTAHSLLYTLTVNLPVLADISGRSTDMIAPMLTVLPHSRMLESEADVIGLFLMAVAGYDPRKAREFWAFLAAQEIHANESPDAAASALNMVTEYWSTHPSHEHRACELEKHEEAAVEVYNAHKHIEHVLREKLANGREEKSAHELDAVDHVIAEVLRNYVHRNNAFWYARQDAAPKA